MIPIETNMKRIYFSEEIAIDMKLDEAIFLHNICYWVLVNKHTKKNFKDGEYWTYNSDTSFCKVYPYFTPAMIRRIRKNLLNAGYIKIGNFNKWSQDKTTWYTYTEKVFEVAHPDYKKSILSRQDKTDILYEELGIS